MLNCEDIHAYYIPFTPKHPFFVGKRRTGGSTSRIRRGAPAVASHNGFQQRKCRLGPKNISRKSGASRQGGDNQEKARTLGLLSSLESLTLFLKVPSLVPPWKPNGTRNILDCPLPIQEGNFPNLKILIRCWTTISPTRNAMATICSPNLEQGYGSFSFGGYMNQPSHAFMTKESLKRIHGRQCMHVGTSCEYAAEQLCRELKFSADSFPKWSLKCETTRVCHKLTFKPRE